MFWRFFIFFLIITLIEIYFLQAVNTFIRDFSEGKKKTVLWIAYALAVFNITIAVVSLFKPVPEWNALFRFVAAAGLVLAVCKLFGISFLIIDDVIRLLRWIYKLIFVKTEITENVNTSGISRIKFLSQLAITFTIIPAISFLYGIIKGAYKFKVHKATVSTPNLPASFDGFKIVQISDMHVGSFLDNSPVKKAFDLVLEQNADMILFTGDLVNNIADETNEFIHEFARLKAPFGVYSVLGNHDYGDYIGWPTPEAKVENLENLKRIQTEAGWKLLLNEHVAIEKNGEKIALLGIENWGANMHFTKYGKMHLAYEGANKYPFKILMSHDPSHWEKQVRTEYKDIDLTLSGHTHGMQFGIEIPGFKWSPVQYIYKQWAGLYKQDNQYLYVNRGLGFLGYPGRVGIWPEITVIELKKA